MQMRQDSTDHAQVRQAGAASIFATTLPQPAALRTIALLATISLVAFTLYMTRPGAEATGDKGASIHITNSTAPATQMDAQQEADSAKQAGNSNANISKIHNEITVNGKRIPAPDNGSLHKTITDGNTTTTVDISNNSNSATTVSSSNVSVQSSSSSTDPEEP